MEIVEDETSIGLIDCDLVDMLWYTPMKSMVYIITYIPKGEKALIEAIVKHIGNKRFQYLQGEISEHSLTGYKWAGTEHTIAFLDDLRHQLEKLLYKKRR